MNVKRNIYHHPTLKKGIQLTKASRKNLSSIIDALTAHIAILDEQGRILLVNQAWKDFLVSNDGKLENYGVGLNYIDMCEPPNKKVLHHSRDSAEDFGAEAAACIANVLRGESDMSRITYPCHSPDEERWFMMTVTPLDMDGLKGAFVTHENVTTLIQREEAAKAALIGTLEAMTNIAEVRDPYTAGHQKNVSRLAADIARQMGLGTDDVKAIELAATVHDIGKVSIPSEILTKPGKLSDYEMALIRTHSQSGFDLLKNIDFPWPIAEIVLQHHERMDGSGYPNGLVGEEICLGARVIAVADTVDAMISHRPYRPGLGFTAANDTIRKGKGIVFSPEVVEAFFSDTVQASLIKYFES